MEFLDFTDYSEFGTKISKNIVMNLLYILIPF